MVNIKISDLLYSGTTQNHQEEFQNSNLRAMAMPIKQKMR